MTATVRIGRRKFLRQAFAALAGLGASFWPGSSRASVETSVRTALFHKLRAMFDGELGSAERIGQAYLAGLASAPSAHAMADELLAAVPDLAGACLRSGIVPFQTVLWQAIRRDFAEERTVELRRHVLSVTECRLFGIAARLGAAGGGTT